MPLSPGDFACATEYKETHQLWARLKTMTHRKRHRSAAFMPLQWTHRLVRRFCTRSRRKNSPVKRHKCRAYGLPMAT